MLLGYKIRMATCIFILKGNIAMHNSKKSAIFTDGYKDVSRGFDGSISYQGATKFYQILEHLT